MGGPKKTRPNLRKTYGSAFRKMSRDAESRVKYADHVCIKDVTAELRTIGYQYQKEDKPLTGVQWVQELMKKVYSAYCQHFDGVVLCMDNESLVPAFKAEEQIERHEARTEKHERDKLKAAAEGSAPPAEIKAFPKGSKLTEGGVLEPNGLAAQPLTMARLLATRELRSSLLDLLVHCVREQGLVNLITGDRKEVEQRCFGRWLIVDANSRVREGGCRANHDQNWREWTAPPVLATANGKLTALTDERFRKPFGEADHQMVFWAHVFRHKDCVLDSNDTDLYATVLSYLEHIIQPGLRKKHNRRGRLLVRYVEHSGSGDKKTSETCIDDMIGLYQAMLDDNFTAAKYCFYAALGGCDFTDKTDVSNGLSETNLLETARKSRALEKAAAVLKTNCVLEEKSFPFTWAHVAAAASGGKYKCFVEAKALDQLDKHLEDFSRAVQGKRRTNTGKHDETLRKVAWCWQYWYNAVRFMLADIPVLDPNTDFEPLLAKPVNPAVVIAPSIREAPAPAPSAPQVENKAVKMDESSDDDDEEDDDALMKRLEAAAAARKAKAATAAPPPPSPVKPVDDDEEEGEPAGLLDESED
jgi:hypothetical protein